MSISRTDTFVLQRKNCQHCGVEILPSTPNFKRKKFCSNACSNARRTTPAALRARFWVKVDKSLGPDACWLWTGAITSHGYGCVQGGGRKVMGAHKLAYILTKGAVPAGLEIMHSCDNRPCCNPAHLSVGTRQDNTDDKVRKGRQARRNVWKKLTADNVLEIRSLRGIEPSGSLSKRFKVEQPHIINIWNRKIWKHVA